MKPPFSPDRELYQGLVTRERDRNKGRCIERNATKTRPSPTSPAVNETSTLPKKTYLPGEPRVQLTDPNIEDYLVAELATDELDQLSPHLWLVAKQDSSHISPLTKQICRGRRIIITEEPRLHLVWYYDRVFIKPLPKYLLSYSFWDFYLTSDDSPISVDSRKKLRQAALGFLRSYTWLIQHRSDFELATNEDHRLLPRNVGSYRGFIHLMQSLEGIGDTLVSPRYHYGELRLSRLNFWVKILQGRFTYHKVEGQYGAYFKRFFGPMLFIFAVFSVILNAMQVVLGAADETTWKSFWETSKWFSVVVLCITAAMALFILLSFILMSSREVIFALKDLYRKRRHQSWRLSKSYGNGSTIERPLDV